MLLTRPSVPSDVPAQRQLWQLSFGDDGAYVDNFYNIYYRPERVLVLEEDGIVRSMTAWFDTTFVLPGVGSYRAAYLYAVATHPDCRGRGLAAKLLADADDYFRTLNIPAVTTVPAEPSLHQFFGANGFGECFTLIPETLDVSTLQAPNVENPLRPASPAQYNTVRESLLADLPHISYGDDALAFQASCCALGGGGLFVGETALGPVCLCAEGDGQGTMIFKELLGGPAALAILPHLPSKFPAQQHLVRTPMYSRQKETDGWKFAMLKWLDPSMAQTWDWSSTAYLGLAFD